MEGQPVELELRPDERERAAEAGPAHAADPAQRALGDPALVEVAGGQGGALRPVAVPDVRAGRERHRHEQLGVGGQLGEGAGCGVHQSWLRSRGLRDQPPSSGRRDWRSASDLRLRSAAGVGGSGWSLLVQLFGTDSFMIVRSAWPY